jgi:hypothetical protein
MHSLCIKGVLELFGLMACIHTCINRILSLMGGNMLNGIELQKNCFLNKLVICFFFLIGILHVWLNFSWHKDEDSCLVSYFYFQN